MKSYIVHGLGIEAVNPMDVGRGPDKEGKPALRVTVETEVLFDPGACAGYVAERTTWLGCENLSVLPVGDEWSLSPL